MRPILVTPEKHREVPWRNGRGISFQVWPRGSVAGRAGFQLNLTPITAGGPFSLYPGIDRILAVTKGGGLSFEGHEGSLATGDAIAFPGEAAMTARLANGPVTVFNLLMKRTEWAGSVRAIRGEAFGLAPDAGEIAVVHMAAGSWRCAGTTVARREAASAHEARRGEAMLGDDSTLIARPGDRLALRPAMDGAMALAFTLRRA